MGDNCVTISGRPDVLASFSTTVPEGIVVHKTLVDTLYHCPLHADGARAQVLDDVTRRGIKFPTYAQVKVPLRSTFDGSVITKDATAGSLVEAVVDMLLTQAVNWDVVVAETVKACPDDCNARLLNVGPGSGLTRSMEREFPRDRVSSLDLTTSGGKSTPLGKPKQDAIAIVGMAVHMPGARDASELWKLLEQGINTISEVRHLLISEMSDY